MSAPYCKKGSRRCPVSKKCVSKKRLSRKKCRTGTRKCGDSKCYNKNKSVKSRAAFYRKYK